MLRQQHILSKIISYNIYLHFLISFHNIHCIVLLYINIQLLFRYPTSFEHDIISKGLLLEFPSLIESERYGENASILAMVNI